MALHNASVFFLWEPQEQALTIALNNSTLTIVLALEGELMKAGKYQQQSSSGARPFVFCLRFLCPSMLHKAPGLSFFTCKMGMMDCLVQESTA